MTSGSDWGSEGDFYIFCIKILHLNEVNSSHLSPKAQYHTKTAMSVEHLCKINAKSLQVIIRL